MKTGDYLSKKILRNRQNQIIQGSIDQNHPSWYWAKGLHDAQIICKLPCTIEYSHLPKSNLQIRNCLELHMDSSKAMFDSTIKLLRFYNFKEITPYIDVDGWFWESDSVAKVGNKFILEINLFRLMNRCKYIVQFELCDVLR